MIWPLIVEPVGALTVATKQCVGVEQGTLDYGVRFSREEPRTTFMRRCNHRHGQFGLIVHRKWMLRFCSKSCKKAYEHKLQEERRAKLRHLAFLAPGAPTNWAGSSEQLPKQEFAPSEMGFNVCLRISNP